LRGVLSVRAEGPVDLRLPPFFRRAGPINRTVGTMFFRAGRRERRVKHPNADAAAFLALPQGGVRVRECNVPA